jgi:predicted DNA-binding transcriptional regulator YafY
LKLLAAVPPSLRPLATRAEGRFHLDPSGWAHHQSPEQPHLRTIAGAVWRDRRLRVLYERGDGTRVHRLLDPLGLVHKTGRWYLVAGEAGTPRVYRADRLRAAEALEAPVARPPGFDLTAFWAAWEAEYAASLPTFAARVRLGPIAQRYRDALGAVSPRAVADEAPDVDGWVRQTLVFDDSRVACAALLALAPEVDVLDPPALREELAALAREVAERNGRGVGR